jgi:hypothetical protein
VVVKQSKRGKMKKLIWNCYKSGKVIKDNCGHVQISWEDLLRRRNLVKDWKQKNKAFELRGDMTLEELSTFPARICWKAVLTEIEPVGEFYAIPVKQLRTERDCIRWTHHLSFKSWIKETNWDSVLLRFCGY